MRRRRALVALAGLLTSCRSTRPQATAHDSVDETPLPKAHPEGRTLAVTLDDPTVETTPLYSADERTSRILRALHDAGIKTTLFVCGKRVDSEDGRRQLAAFDEAGHTIANHTYSHPYFHSPKVTLESYQADLVRGESVIAGYRGFSRVFRFPFLKEGDTREKRDGMRAFLRERGYTTGHVTIDDSDWYVDERLGKRLVDDPRTSLAGYRDYYLRHLAHRADFYDGLARRLLGRPVAHTLLLHHSLLNALFLGDALAMFRAEGYRLVDAKVAFADPIFAAAPDVLPAGESLLLALARERGLDAELRYPGEDGDYERIAMDALGL